MIHYHALLGGDGLDDLRGLDWMDESNKLAGFARIEVPERARVVQDYGPEYVIKDGLIGLGGPIDKPSQHAL